MGPKQTNPNTRNRGFIFIIGNNSKLKKGIPMDFGSISNVEHVTSQRACLDRLLPKHAFFKYET